MEKHRKRKRIISALLCSIVLLCAVLVPTGAVSINSQYTPTPSNGNTTLQGSFRSNLPCSLTFINHLNGGLPNDNPVITVGDNAILYGANIQEDSQNEGLYTYTTPYINQNFSYTETIANKLGGNDVTTTKAKAFEYQNHTIYNSDMFATATNNTLTGETIREYNVLKFNLSTLVGVDNRSDSSEQYSYLPYGFILHGNDFIVSPRLYEQYLSGTALGSNAYHGTVHTVDGIGGVLIMLEHSSNYSSAYYKYTIEYIDENGALATWTNDGEKATNYIDTTNSVYPTMRIPLLPIGFMEDHKYEDIMYIKSVDVNVYGGLRYGLNTGSVYYYAINNFWLCDYDQPANYPYKIELNDNFTSVLYANAIRFGGGDGGDGQIQNPAWSNVTSWLATAVGGFLDFEIGYGITLGGILCILIAFSFVIVFLKFFAGG